MHPYVRIGRSGRKKKEEEITEAKYVTGRGLPEGKSD